MTTPLPAGSLVHYFDMDFAGNKTRRCVPATVTGSNPDDDKVILEVRNQQVGFLVRHDPTLRYRHSSGIQHPDGVDVTHMTTRQREPLGSYHLPSECPGPIER